MKYKLPLIFIIIFVFSCGKKEIVKETSIPGKKEKPAIVTPPSASLKEYNNKFYENLILFISKNNITNKLPLYMETLSNEFDTFTIYRKNRLDKAIENYQKMLIDITNDEEKIFIKQRIGISLYKKGEYEKSFDILTNVLVWLNENKIRNDEIYYYISLHHILRNDLKSAISFLKLSKPSILTVDGMGYNYLLAKLFLWSNSTNEAQSYLNKSINIDKKQFENRYGEEAKILFKNLYVKEEKGKDETFKISLDLPYIFNNIKKIEYYYELPDIVSRPTISRFRNFITNQISLQNKFYCFYEDYYFKNETNSFFLITALPIQNKVTAKELQSKDIYFATTPIIILFDIVKKKVIETNIVSNLILTNNIEITNSQRIDLPFNYLWKIEKVEYNNDEFWDYLIIGINKSNQISYVIFDPASNQFLVKRTNNIERNNESIIVSKNKIEVK